MHLQIWVMPCNSVDKHPGRLHGLWFFKYLPDSVLDSIYLCLYHLSSCIYSTIQLMICRKDIMPFIFLVKYLPLRKMFDYKNCNPQITSLYCLLCFSKPITAWYVTYLCVHLFIICPHTLGGMLMENVFAHVFIILHSGPVTKKVIVIICGIKTMLNEKNMISSKNLSK